MTKEIQKEVDNFFSRYPQHRQPAGTILVQAGESPVGVYFLIEGTVKQYAITLSGEEVIVNLFRPPAFFPMSWAINGTSNAYFMEAETDLVYHLAPRQEIIQFIQSHPDVMYNLLSRVYRGTDGLLQRMSYLMAGNKYANVVTEILITAKRFGQPGPTPGSMELDLAQQELASRSGMTRETANREIRQLKDRGLIVINHGRIVIPDLAKLEAELTEQ